MFVYTEKFQHDIFIYLFLYPYLLISENPYKVGFNKFRDFLFRLCSRRFLTRTLNYLRKSIHSRTKRQKHSTDTDLLLLMHNVLHHYCSTQNNNGKIIDPKWPQLSFLTTILCLRIWRNGIPTASIQTDISAGNGTRTFHNRIDPTFVFVWVSDMSVWTFY